MAKTASEVEQTQAPDDGAAAKDERAALEELPAGTRVSVMVTMPKELKLKLLEEAENAGENMTLARFVRETLADRFDVDLPDVIRTRSRKYATEEERQAAQKEKNKARSELIKKLLAAYKSGDIDLNALDDDDDDE